MSPSSYICLQNYSLYNKKTASNAPKLGIRDAAYDGRKTTGGGHYDANDHSTEMQHMMVGKRRGVDTTTLMTIRQRLLEYNITWCSTKIELLLSKRRNRLQWLRGRDWSNVVFTDESYFWTELRRKKGWTMRGSIEVQLSVKHSVKRAS
ncbi:hypothetical protein QE152_g7701 [Popillia japonica]|uniref:Transposase n=1 Tax=Popillia japonica TaxID=7064 RepID=A0AAW1MFA1_POPJA